MIERRSFDDYGSLNLNKGDDNLMNNDQILPLKLSCFPRTYFEVSPLKWMEIRGLLLPSFLCLPTVASGTTVDSAVVEISPL